jgi:tRNA (guanine-N7-)-methyltransferase
MNSVEDIILEPPADGVVVDPMSWFATPGPFELEIGCGKGGFLLNRARSAPQVRLLGIEWANKFFQFAADRMARWNLTNVRVMRTDAKPFVMRQLPPESLTVLHLYHPDPWPKKRHHKRRLVQSDFAEAVVRLLAPGGRWLIQSDHAEYFDQMREVAGGRSELAERPWEQLAVDAGAQWGGTNYEIKYSREGRRIYRAAFVKFDANAVSAV